MEIYFFTVPHPRRYGVKIWGTAGGWLVGSSSQTLLLSDCPCFIYTLTFEVIFPCLRVMHLNLTLKFSHSFPASKGWDGPRDYGVKESGFLFFLFLFFFWSPGQLEAMLSEKSLQIMLVFFLYGSFIQMAYYKVVTYGYQGRNLTLLWWW